MRLALFTALTLAACADPATEETIDNPGTQVGEEGDEPECIEVRDVVTDLDALYGGLDFTPAAFLATAETPVSGSFAFPDGTIAVSLALSRSGTVWYAHEEPRRDTVPASACTLESYFAEVSGTLSGAPAFDQSFTAEAWGFTGGHAYVGIRVPCADLNGDVAPETLDPDAWDELVFFASGGSTDGVWTFHFDWLARNADNTSDEESIVDGTLSP